MYEVVYLAILSKLFWQDGMLISPAKITEGKIFILSNLNMAKMAANLNLHHYVQTYNSDIRNSLKEAGEHLF